MIVRRTTGRWRRWHVFRDAGSALSICGRLRGDPAELERARADSLPAEHACESCRFITFRETMRYGQGAAL